MASWTSRARQSPEHITYQYSAKDSILFAAGWAGLALVIGFIGILGAIGIVNALSGGRLLRDQSPLAALEYSFYGACACAAGVGGWVLVCEPQNRRRNYDTAEMVAQQTRPPAEKIVQEGLSDEDKRMLAAQAGEMAYKAVQDYIRFHEGRATPEQAQALLGRPSVNGKHIPLPAVDSNLRVGDPILHQTAQHFIAHARQDGDLSRAHWMSVHGLSRPEWERVIGYLNDLGVIAPDGRTWKLRLRRRDGMGWDGKKAEKEAVLPNPSHSSRGGEG